VTPVIEAAGFAVRGAAAQRDDRCDRRQERDMAADHRPDDVPEGSAGGSIEAVRPRDRPPEVEGHHLHEDVNGGRTARNTFVQLRRKNDHPRMKRCQPSQSQRPNRRKRPRASS
jgi:hypothetical protein